MSIESLKPYLSTLNDLWAKSSDGNKGYYIHPKLKNLGVVNIVLIREIVAPAIIRNQEQTITDINIKAQKDGEDYIKQVVRAVPNKFKHKERQHGLRILRHYDAGGKHPQNRNVVSDKAKASEAFDINSLIFGDSTNRGGSVLPVKASTLYSDGLSLSDYQTSVDKTFHISAMEDGTLWDAIEKKNSSNLFERHFVVPGTLLVQTITLSGKTLPFELLEHLILSIGLSGAYGGQTSITGTNVRTHIAGIYASKLEKAEASPYILSGLIETDNVMEAKNKIDAILSPLHETVISSTDAEAYREKIVQELLNNSEEQKKRYQYASEKVAELFDGWFDKAPGK